MSGISGVVFSVAVVYVVLGNALVYVVLTRRGVTTSLMWSGNPGYLLRRCREAGQPRLALLSASTVLALLVAVIAAIAMFVGAAT